MKTFWKVLGFAALAAGLTPYKVEKDEETGESSYQALLWRGSSKPGEGDSKREILINLGEGTLTSKVLDAVEKKKEAHLFSDELSVEYSVDDDDVADDVAAAAEEAAAAAEEAVAAVEDAAVAAENAAVAAAEDIAEATEEAVAAVEDAAAVGDAVAAAEDAATKTEE